MWIAPSTEKDKELVENTLASQVKILTEKYAAMRRAFARALDARAVLDLLPNCASVQDTHEEQIEALWDLMKEYSIAQNDFFIMIIDFTKKYPDIAIPQAEWRETFPLSCDLFVRWHKEYRMGKI